VTRCDIGEKNSGDVNTATSAIAQAFKRACVKFGLGRHLYTLESVWVPYDGQRKQITSKGYDRLRRLVAGETPRAAEAPPTESNGNGKAPSDGNDKATVGTKAWGDKAKEMAKKVPYFMTSNGPNYHHMLAAALKLGFDAVTDSNLDDVITALERHAQEAANEEAA
jgi:hypothetical protein